MKTLLILRHAKSSWDDPTLDDRDRPLNPRGERDAPLMGQLVARNRLAVELIISSDALRARMTALAIADATGYRNQIRVDGRLYHASAAAIVAVVRDVVEHNLATVMIVGHNPGLEELVARLTNEPEDLPTAALAQIALPIDRWRDLTTSTRGTLLGLWKPKKL